MPTRLGNRMPAIVTGVDPDAMTPRPARASGTGTPASARIIRSWAISGSPPPRRNSTGRTHPR